MGPNISSFFYVLNLFCVYLILYFRYDAKRIIVREGHVPMCFYFILTGSGKLFLITVIK